MSNVEAGDCQLQYCCKWADAILSHIKLTLLILVDKDCRWMCSRVEKARFHVIQLTRSRPSPDLEADGLDSMEQDVYMQAGPLSYFGAISSAYIA